MKLNPLKCVRSQIGKVFRLYGDLERNRIQSYSTQSYNGLSTSYLQESDEQLTGWLTALRQFISCFTDRLKQFFITLKGAKRAGWDEEYDQAFMVIK